MSAVYSRPLHYPRIYLVYPSTSSPPPRLQHQILHKHCLHFFLGGGERTTVMSPCNSREKLETMLLWGRSGGRGHKKLRSNAKVVNFRVGCDVSCYRLFIFSYFLFHQGYGCRENATRGVPLQLSLLEGISPSLSKLLFTFPVSCPVVRSWLFWGVKPFVDTFSPCPCLGVATSCSTSLQSLSSSGSVLLS